MLDNHATESESEPSTPTYKSSLPPPPTPTHVHTPPAPMRAALRREHSRLSVLSSVSSDTAHAKSPKQAPTRNRRPTLSLIRDSPYDKQMCTNNTAKSSPSPSPSSSPSLTRASKLASSSSNGEESSLGQSESDSDSGGSEGDTEESWFTTSSSSDSDESSYSDSEYSESNREDAASVASGRKGANWRVLCFLRVSFCDGESVHSI